MKPWIHLLAPALLLPLSVKAEEVKAEATPEVAPYLRVTETDQGQNVLEIAWRSFQSDSGPTIWLAGVSHIGSSNYYARLQEELDGVDLVLYEGVNDPVEDGDAKPLANAAERDDGAQALMADMLGLVFQLKHIDYSGDHFEHCDMDMATLMQELSGDNGEGTQSKEAFEQMASQMSGEDASLKLLEVLGVFLKASPQMQSMVKLLLIETLGNLPSDLDSIAGMPPEMMELMTVLLDRRNEVVLERLAKLDKGWGPDKQVAVFYGAAHNVHLEEELRKKGYTQTGELWFPAMGVSPASAGLSPSSVQMFRQMMKAQLGGSR